MEGVEDVIIEYQTIQSGSMTKLWSHMTHQILFCPWIEIRPT